MTDEEKEVVKAQYERYVKIINEQGKTIDDVAAQYDKDYPSESSTESSSKSSQETTSSASSEKSSQPETTSSEASTESSTESSNPSTTKSSSVQSSIEDLSNENFVFGDEVKKKLKEMKDNEAAYVATSSAYYFLYKTPIADEVSSALDKNNTSNYRSKILHSIKDDEFDKYIEEQGKKIDYESMMLHIINIHHQELFLIPITQRTNLQRLQVKQTQNLQQNPRLQAKQARKLQQNLKLQAMQKVLHKVNH